MDKNEIAEGIRLARKQRSDEIARKLKGALGVIFFIVGCMYLLAAFGVGR